MECIIKIAPILISSISLLLAIIALCFVVRRDKRDEKRFKFQELNHERDEVRFEYEERRFKRERMNGYLGKYAAEWGNSIKRLKVMVEYDLLNNPKDADAIKESLSESCNMVHAKTTKATNKMLVDNFPELFQFPGN